MSELEIVLPTGKGHVSFSELKTWVDCGWAHKLIHIDKLSEFEDSIYSDFGTVIHEGCEEYLESRSMNVDKVVQKIEEFWSDRGYPDVDNWPEYDSAVPELDYWTTTAERILDSVPSFLDEQFPDWEFVNAEEQFREPIGDTGYFFKGFIDAIIKVKNKRGKEIYWLIDWKTASSAGWYRTKRRDPTVLMQLVLYKHFWAQKHGIPLKDIRCAFILLKRDNPDPVKRKKNGNRCSIIKVSAGPKTIEKSLKRVFNMISALNRTFFLKNRTNCKFCEFLDTEHCKR